MSEEGISASFLGDLPEEDDEDTFGLGESDDEKTDEQLAASALMKLSPQKPSVKAQTLKEKAVKRDRCEDCDKVTPILYGWEALKRDGFVVFNVLGNEDPRAVYESCFKIQEQWSEYRQLDKIKGYLTESKPALKYGARFGVFINPSSFHCPDVREWRRKVKAAALVEFQGCSLAGMELLIDQLSFAYLHYHLPDQGAKIGRIMTSNRTDITCRGWLNLSESEQTLVCIPGSHLAPTLRSNQKVRFVGVPPGYAIVYSEYLKYYRSNVRIEGRVISPKMFFGLRFTNQSPGSMLYPETLVSTKTGGVPPLPDRTSPGTAMILNERGGQNVMYPVNDIQKHDWVERTFLSHMDTSAGCQVSQGKKYEYGPEDIQCIQVEKIRN